MNHYKFLVVNLSVPRIIFIEYSVNRSRTVVSLLHMDLAGSEGC